MSGRPRCAAYSWTAGCYVLACGALAAAGGATGDVRWYLAAIVATLPLGVLAVIGVYVGYALLQGVGGLLVPVTTAGGDQAGWLHAGSTGLNVALFAAAALGNVVLGNVVLGAMVVRRRQRAQSRHADLLP